MSTPAELAPLSPVEEQQLVIDTASSCSGSVRAYELVNPMRPQFTASPPRSDSSDTRTSRKTRAE